MAACKENAGGSFVMERTAASGLRLWSLFSGAAFRRKLIEALMCGVSQEERKAGVGDNCPPPPPPIREEKEKPGSSPLEESRRHTRSERLSELLKLDVMESGSELEAETRRKMKVLEELQGVVKRLQSSGDVDSEQDLRKMEAAKDVRRLAKEDAEARETLAMLGAIPPLVVMLDSPDVNIQEASLYALLNLGVGNDK